MFAYVDRKKCPLAVFVYQQRAVNHVLQVRDVNIGKFTAGSLQEAYVNAAYCCRLLYTCSVNWSVLDTSN